MEGKSGHQNQHSLHLYLIEIIGFFQLKSEGFVEVSGDIFGCGASSTTDANNPDGNDGGDALDVITTGKSSKECDDLVKNFGGETVGYGCIIDRSNKQSLLKEKIVSQISINIPTFQKDNLPSSLSKIKAIKPGSRKI